MRKIPVRIALVTAVLIGGILLIFGGAIRRLVTPPETVVARVHQDVVTLREANVLIDYELISSGYTRSSMARESRKILSDIYKGSLDERAMSKLYLLKAEELKIAPLSFDEQLNPVVWANINYQDHAIQFAMAGVTLNDIVQIETERRTADLLKEEITRNITVSDGEVRAVYDDQLARQRERYTKNPSEYQFDQRYQPDTVIVYRPQEFRVVKHVLIPFPQDVAYEIITAFPDEQKEMMVKYRPQIQSQADDVLAKARQGQDFGALMAVTLQNHNPCGDELNYFYLKTQYEMGACIDCETELKDAALALKNPGDMTGLISTEYGYHILQWVATEPAGAIPFEEAKSAIADQILKSKKAAAWKAAVDQWKAEANIEEYPGRIP